VRCGESHGLETRYTLCLERLHGVGLELIVASETFIETHNAMRFESGNLANNFDSQLTIEANDHHAARIVLHAECPPPGVSNIST
jgi:hypothetical protein